MSLRDKCIEAIADVEGIPPTLRHERMLDAVLDTLEANAFEFMDDVELRRVVAVLAAAEETP